MDSISKAESQSATWKLNSSSAMADPNSQSSEEHLSPTLEGDQPSVLAEQRTQLSDHADAGSISGLPDHSLGVPGDGDGDGDEEGDGEGSSCRSEALGRGISTLLTGVIKEFDSNAADTARSQDQLSGALDRLTRELDQLLEDAPLPFIMQHAARISGVKKRVSSLNVVLRSVQRRLDNIDRALTIGLQHGHGFSWCDCGGLVWFKCRNCDEMRNRSRTCVNDIEKKFLCSHFDSSSHLDSSD